MGSRAGKPNKNKSFLMNRLQEQYGDDFHPIMKMADNAVRLQEILDEVPPEDIDKLFVGLKMSVDAWDKIAQYTEPKLKAIEVTGEISTRPMLVDLSGGKLTESHTPEGEDD